MFSISKIGMNRENVTGQKYKTETVNKKSEIWSQISYFPWYQVQLLWKGKTKVRIVKNERDPPLFISKQLIKKVLKNTNVDIMWDMR